MKWSDTLDVFIGIDEVRQQAKVFKDKLPPESDKVLNNDTLSGKASVLVGLGIKEGTKFPHCIVLVNVFGMAVLLSGENPVEIADYLKNDVPGYPIQVSISVATELARLFSMDKWDFERPKWMDEDYLKGGQSHSTVWSMPKNPIKPTNNSRELTTIHDSRCLQELMRWVPKQDFMTLSKKVLKGSTAMLIIAKPPDDNDKDSLYMMIARIGEETNDPLEAKLLGMIAYQPEVLKNGVMYNDTIEEHVREYFELEYNKHF